MLTHSVHRSFYYLGFIHPSWVFLNSPSKNGGPCYLQGDTVTDFVCLLLFRAACMSPQVKAGVTELWQCLDHDPNDGHVQSGQPWLHCSVHVSKVKVVVVQQVPYNINGLMMNDGIASSKKRIHDIIFTDIRLHTMIMTCSLHNVGSMSVWLTYRCSKFVSRIAYYVHPLCKTWI